MDTPTFPQPSLIGLTGLDITEYAKSIVPETTPLVNLLSRTKAACQCPVRYWKTVTAFDSTPGNPSSVAYSVQLVQSEDTSTLDPISAEGTGELADLVRQTKEAEEVFLLRQIIAFAHRYPTSGNVLGTIVDTPRDESGAFSIDDLDGLLLRAYQQASADPSILLTHPDMVPHKERKAHINPATGSHIPVILDVFCPKGVILGLSLSLPFPVPEISHGIDVEVQQDYFAVEYGGDVKEHAVHVLSMPRVRFAGGLILLHGITE